MQYLNNDRLSFWPQNEKVLAAGADATRQTLYRDAEKYCKIILGRVSRRHGCMTCLTFTVIALAVGVVFISPNMESWDLKKLSAVLNSQQSFWGHPCTTGRRLLSAAYHVSTTPFAKGKFARNVELVQLIPILFGWWQK